ncbi:MAG TPA: FGGY family carbohydrate kinase [Ktedonobacteraceae bacterium]|nr:FGGY family carbohydrate kinase [Ktedonobacteraceae bacterium]
MKSLGNAEGNERPAVVLGIDLGTSGVRVVAFSETLQPLAEAGLPCSIQLVAGGGVEQNVLEVADAVEHCLAAVIAELGQSHRVLALVLCGTASSLCSFQREDGTPRGSAWLWSDSRAHAQADELKQRYGNALYERTGCPMHSSYWSAKLLWYHHQRGPSDLNKHASHQEIFAGIKDFIVYRLTGVWVTDVPTATATGLYDTKNDCWDNELLDELHIAASMLPAVSLPTAQLSLRDEVASRLGLPVTSAVVIGSFDGILAHLGLGCVEPLSASCMVATSSAVRLSVAERTLDPQARTWCYPTGEGTWVIGGATNNGGNALTWFKDVLEDRQPGESEEGAGYELVNSALQAETIAGEELVFLPYLYGERSPLWRDDLRGALIGLSPLHGQRDIVRAILEGVGLQLSDLLHILSEQVGAQPVEIRGSGRFTGSPDWAQLQADIFGVPIFVGEQKQVSARGAAIIGWRSLTGDSLQKFTQNIQRDSLYEPRTSEHTRHVARFERFTTYRSSIFPSLRTKGASD